MNILFCALILLVGMIAIMKSGKWSVKLQEYYISQSRKMYGSSIAWEKPWIRVLFRAMIIFIGLSLIIVAYPLAFGTIYINW